MSYYAERQSGECMGRTLEAFTVRPTAKRPDYYTRAEMAARAAKRAARLNRHNGLMWYEIPATEAWAREYGNTGHVKKRVMVVIVSRL